jgi:membrane fusion protein
MSDQGLFRQEVLEHKKHQNLATVWLELPKRYTHFMLGLCFVMAGLLVFILCGEFSAKYVVQGYLESSKGLVRVIAQKPGVIVASYVHQGNKVKRGDKLFLIDNLYEGLSHPRSHRLYKQLKKKMQMINEALALKEKELNALKPLLEKHYIPLAVYQQAQDALHGFLQQKNSVEMDILQYQRQVSYVIYSPIDGFVASLPLQEGQYISPLKPLLKIIPGQADLVAELFVPVQQAGFLQKNSEVLLRYDAYPHERFGVARARIIEISRSVLVDEEEEKPLRIGKPYYKVRAQLEQQFVLLQHFQKKLRQGMSFSAVILGPKKKVWQWLFDPIYRFSGGISS